MNRRNHFVSVSGSEFTANSIPVENVINGFVRSGLKGYYAVPRSRTTATKNIDYHERVGRIHFDHGQSKAVFVINVKDDDISEANEVLQISLFDPRYENGLMAELGMKILERGGYTWENKYIGQDYDKNVSAPELWEMVLAFSGKNFTSEVLKGDVIVFRRRHLHGKAS